MTVRHLEIFIAVADTGKMSLAAKQLFISQPSVSQAIKEIEEYYNIKLFERLSKKLFITEQGIQLLNHARYLVEGFDKMEQKMYQINEKPVLRVGGTVTVGVRLMSILVTEFEEYYPKVNTKVWIDNITEMEKGLLNSNLDLAILEGEVSSPDLVSTPVYHDRLVVFGEKNHPLFKKKKVTIQDLEGENMLLREQGSSARIIIDEVLMKNKISVNCKWCSSNTEAIKQAVKVGQGLGVLSTLLIEEELRRKEFRILPIQDVSISRTINLVFHKNKYQSEYMKAFIDIVLQCKKLLLKDENINKV